MADDGSRSVCGYYSHFWSCRSFSLSFETCYEPLRRSGLYTNEFLSGVPAN